MKNELVIVDMQGKSDRCFHTDEVLLHFRFLYRYQYFRQMIPKLFR